MNAHPKWLILGLIPIQIGESLAGLSGVLSSVLAKDCMRALKTSGTRIALVGKCFQLDSCF
ncbi:MAG: hypothetical protein N5P05_004168 (plasmid) [Chroococcopsis gigantea SAG 12.99]|nr:hypothetical protein [Chroococcopsis gigantea SAG 12.99]